MSESRRLEPVFARMGGGRRGVAFVNGKHGGEKMKRDFWKICTAAVFSVILAGAMGLVSPAWAESYKFGVSKPGGAWYPIGTAIQRLAEKQYGDKVTLDIGGGLANALNAMRGKIEFGLTFNSTVADALKGRGPFKGKNASDLRLAAVQYNQLMVWVVWADSGITHWSQLKGKRVNAMPKRFSAQALNKQMLQGLGMSYKDFTKVLHLGFNDAVSQMKDGHIDAYLGPGERNYAPLIQLAAHKPIRILSFSEEDIRRMRAVQPALVPVVMEKKYYNQPKDVRVVQTYQIVVTNKNVSENLVYKLAKLMYGNLDYMRKVNPNFKRVTAKAAAQDLGVKRHPGLTRYLKEVGAL
ncbi:MAG: TAXI family TRAP transporter solute-binding subunit [Nitrospinota bacterium]